MTQSEFDTQMGRLADAYPKAYSQERVKLVWREVGTLPAAAWTRVVDTLIGECRMPPLLPEIRDAVARARERNRAFEKEAERAVLTPDAFQGEERKMLCRMILDIMAGKCTLDQFERLMRGMR